MPSVRIVGEIPQAASDFLQQLRDRGYEIEVLSVKDASSSHADLEITLQECSAGGMLGNVVALANGGDVNFVISPGSLAWLAQSANEAPQPEASVESPSAEVLQTPELTVEVQQPVFEQEIDVPKQALQEPAAAQEFAEAVSKPLELSDSGKQEADEANRLNYVAGDPEASLKDREQPAFQERPEPEKNSEVPLYAELFKSSENLVPVEDESRTNNPEPQSRFSESQQSRLAPPELTAFQSAEVFSDWPIWNAAAADEVPTETVAEPHRLKAYVDRLKHRVAGFKAQVVRSKVQAQRSAVKVWSGWQQVLAHGSATRILRNDRLFTKVATGATGLAIVLLLVTATAHRFSPLPLRIVQGSSEALRPAPFQKSAITAAASASTIQEPVTSPSLSPALTGLKHVRGSAVSAVPVKVSSHRSVADDEFVAKNTVIRYTQHVASGIAGEVSDPGVKYYTDLKENR